MDFLMGLKSRSLLGISQDFVRTYVLKYFARFGCDLSIFHGLCTIFFSSHVTFTQRGKY